MAAVSVEALIIPWNSKAAMNEIMYLGARINLSSHCQVFSSILGYFVELLYRSRSAVASRTTIIVYVLTSLVSAFSKAEGL